QFQEFVPCGSIPHDGRQLDWVRLWVLNCDTGKASPVRAVRQCLEVERERETDDLLSGSRVPDRQFGLHKSVCDRIQHQVATAGTRGDVTTVRTPHCMVDVRRGKIQFFFPGRQVPDAAFWEAHRDQSSSVRAEMYIPVA